MLRLSLAPDLPLAGQIVDALRRRIDDRILQPGTRLPSIREFATNHQVSRHTAVEAYDRLTALGYLRSQRGSGFYVTGPSVPKERAGEGGSLGERPVDVVWLLSQMFAESRSAADGSPRVEAGAGCLPDAWLDDEGVRRQLRALVRRADLKIAGYGTPQGYPPLREQLALKLAAFSIAALPTQIVSTMGALQAVDLVIRGLLKPGDTVFVDDPGYFNLCAALRLFGARVVGVPREGDGPDVASLEALLAVHVPRLYFTQSVLHNPTSANLSPAKAFRLLQLAERHDFLLVEDDVHGDLHPGTATRLATLDQLQRVIYIGGFSKTLSGDLRVGFLAARPDLARSLSDVKMLACVATPEFSERLVYLMLTEGHYRKFLDRLHGRLAEGMAATLRRMEAAGMEVFGDPRAGMFLWARLPEVADAAPLAARAATEGIFLAPGKVFRPHQEPSPWLRFNVARCGEPRLWDFLDRAKGMPI